MKSKRKSSKKVVKKVVGKKRGRKPKAIAAPVQVDIVKETIPVVALKVVPLPKEKKQPQTISEMDENQIGKLLLSYSNNTNLQNNIVTRNRGGSKERTFNDTTVEGLIFDAIYKVIVKVTSYRKEKAEGGPVKRQFEDIPLVIRYFDTTIQNLLKDEANGADAQKRGRYEEISTVFTSEDGKSEIIYGNWAEISNKEKNEVITDIDFKLRTVFASENNINAEKLIKLFNLQFRDGTDDPESLSSELGTSEDTVLSLREQLNKALIKNCPSETGELFRIIRDNPSDWDIKRDDVKAANKSHLEACKVEEDQNLKQSDMNCITDTSFTCIRDRLNGGFVAKIAIQILRDAKGTKEVAETVRIFEKTFQNREEAMNYRNEIAMEIKIAENLSKKRCHDRKILAAKVFSYKVAS